MRYWKFFFDRTVYAEYLQLLLNYDELIFRCCMFWSANNASSEVLDQKVLVQVSWQAMALQELAWPNHSPTLLP